MSRGPGRLERAITELFNATEDKALSIGEICDVAFQLGGLTASRAQRLSATRAAHRLLDRCHEQAQAEAQAFSQAHAAATQILGRGPKRRRDVCFFVGSSIRAVDEEFAKVMTATAPWRAWLAAWQAYRPFNNFGRYPKWCTTETADRRLYFHPANFAVRVWVVDIVRAGVLWAEVESIDKIDEENVYVNYAGATARLNRRRLHNHWALWRGLYFTNQRAGYAAQMFDAIWRDRYWHLGDVPLQMRLPLAEAMALLGVPANYTREDIIDAFRRAVKKAHPDAGGTAELFCQLVEARDRLLASLGTAEPAPTMPTYNPPGYRARYTAVRLGQTRRISSTRRLSHG
jgi:hypothetical protein